MKYTKVVRADIMPVQFGTDWICTLECGCKFARTRTSSFMKKAQNPRPQRIKHVHMSLEERVALLDKKIAAGHRAIARDLDALAKRNKQEER